MIRIKANLEANMVTVTQTLIDTLRAGAAPGRIFDLTDVDLSCIDLSGVNLKGARLWRTNFAGANLRGADLTDACARDANFRGADLTDANLLGLVRDGASFEGATMPSGRPYAKRVLTDAERADLLALADAIEADIL